MRVIYGYQVREREKEIERLRETLRQIDIYLSRLIDIYKVLLSDAKDIRKYLGHTFQDSFMFWGGFMLFT